MRSQKLLIKTSIIDNSKIMHLLNNNVPSFCVGQNYTFHGEKWSEQLTIWFNLHWVLILFLKCFLGDTKSNHTKI
jgi:hypothetical protein